MNAPNAPIPNNLTLEFDILLWNTGKIYFLSCIWGGLFADNSFLTICSFMTTEKQNSMP